MDARFCKPLDTDMLRRLAKEHPVMITVEEGSIGGFAAHVMQVWLLQVAPCTLVRMLAAHAPTKH